MTGTPLVAPLAIHSNNSPYRRQKPEAHDVPKMLREIHLDSVTRPSRRTESRFMGPRIPY